MSYEKKTWARGNKVTSSDLNNIEGGIDDLQNFVVELTPTAADYSGTMDKTPAEIDAAIQGGKRILFSIPGMGGLVEASQFLYDTTDAKWNAHANIVFDIGNNTNVLMHISTSTAIQYYYVFMFPLTPLT